MSENIQYFERQLSRVLPKPDERKIVLITGARQTGKTTLAKRLYPGLAYFNLDAPELRHYVRSIPALRWDREIGRAVLDEAQKEQSLFEKVKYAYDEGLVPFTVLLGSSQILLQKNVRESLAGRVWLYDLWPLSLCEYAGKGTQDILLDQLLTRTDIDPFLSSLRPLLSPLEYLPLREAEDSLLAWGGMPALIALSKPEEKREWLQNYIRTYLERDLRDLARIGDLEPFQKFQQLAAFRMGSLLHYSEIARDAGISVDTARRYFEYLKISYQVLLLQPYGSNRAKNLIKTPKLYWIDVGIQRALTRSHESPVTGSLFENYVISELYKHVRTLHREVSLSFYRSRGGLEVDCLLETPKGILALEIKNRDTVGLVDARRIRDLEQSLGPSFLGGLVVYRGDTLHPLRERIWAIPSWRLLGSITELKRL